MSPEVSAPFETLSLQISWWLPALIFGATSPFWIRLIVNRWEQQARLRSERVLDQLKKEPPLEKEPTSDREGVHGEEQEEGK